VDITPQSFPGASDGQVALDVLLHHLRHRHLEVLLRYVDATLPQREHSCLCAHGLRLGARSSQHLLADLSEVDSPHQVHLARVNFKNLDSGVEGGIGEFDFAVDAAGSQQGGIQDIDSVGGHDDLDGLGGFESVQLIEQFKHGPLNLGVASLSLHTGAADGVDLVDEDDAGGVLSGHYEQFSHHASALADVLLHEFRAGDSDEGAVGVVSDGSGEQGLAGSRRTVHEDSLGLGNAQRLEDLGVLDGEFDDFLHFLHLLVESSDHVVGGVGNLLDLHEGDEGVDLGGENFMQNVVV
jgi:hypothetical protein